MSGRRFWTEEEKQFVIDNYDNMSNKEIGKKLNRTENAIKSFAVKHGIRRVAHYWSEEENNILRKWYPEWGVDKTHEKLPHRAKTAIAKQAQKLGVKCDLITQRQNLGLRTHDMPKGFYMGTHGYWVYSPTGRSEDRILYHRYVMEKHLGRELSSEEIVHHIDEDKLNNCISNLEIMTRSEHARHHHGDLSDVRDSPAPSES